MIIFHTVRFRNFLSTGNLFTEIPLDKSKRTLIYGENGAGKSTILEAISYALYGRPLRNINKPQLINSINNKQMLVELEFSIAKNRYTIKRGMKPNLFQIYSNDKLIDQDSAARDYQEMLETQILKMNFKSFSQIFVLSIANYTPFMKLTAASRREVIEDLLDIQIFSVMNSLLKEKIAINKESIISSDYELKLIQNKIDMHKTHLLEIDKNNKQTIKEKNEAIKALNAENKKLLATITKTTKELERLKEKLKGREVLKSKKTEKHSLTKEVENKIARITKDITFYDTNTKCPTCKQELEDDFRTKEVERKNKLLRDANSALEKLNKDIEQIVSKIDEFDVIQEHLLECSEMNSDATLKMHTNSQIIQAMQEEIIKLEESMHKAKKDNKTEKGLQKEYDNELKRRNDLIDQREILNMASQLLKDGGIKTKIIRQYVPVINKLINKYLGAMDFFVHFELDETFKESIKSRFRDEFSYESFSQGEKLRIDLALLFTWRAIAKMRNSASSNLLFMDEILDSSLDSGGIDEFLKIITQLTGDTNVFIISHRGDQMIDKFTDTIRFEKHRNFSRIAA